MKNIVKRFFVYAFKILTKIYLGINKISVIAITGSAGKTTVKSALKQFLPQDMVYVPVENYNTEIGVPLAVFGEKTPEKILSLTAWLKILFSMFAKLFKRPKYKKIVLEFSADHPGDIKYLSDFIRPEISVITTVLPVHTLEFKTVENIAKEKGYLAENTKKKGTVILNADNKYVKQMKNRTRAKVVFVGESESADIRWNNVKYDANGMSFEIFVRGQKYRVRTSLVAPQLIQSLISAMAVGLELNMEVRDLIGAIESFKTEKGRMNLIQGMNGSTIIDDSYNANPESMKKALEVLAGMPGRKIAALGSMKELGALEKTGHEEVVKTATEKADIVILSGEEITRYSKKKKGRMNKKIVQFDNSIEAGEYLKTIIEKGDFILVKGSQGAFMEEAAKQILRDPENAGEFLVRQGKMWEDKKVNLGRKDV